MPTKHRYESTKKDFLALHNFPIGNESLCFFPKTYISQTSIRELVKRNPKTISFASSNFLLPKFMFPKCECHNLFLSSIVELN